MELFLHQMTYRVDDFLVLFWYFIIIFSNILLGLSNIPILNIVPYIHDIKQFPNDLAFSWKHPNRISFFFFSFFLNPRLNVWLPRKFLRFVTVLQACELLQFYPSILIINKVTNRSKQNFKRSILHVKKFSEKKKKIIYCDLTNATELSCRVS